MFAFQMTPVVRALLLLNIVFYAAEPLLGVPVRQLFSFHTLGTEGFQPYQFVTHFFVHANLDHLLSNMIGLFFFGPLIERQLTSKRFLQLYMVSALGVALLFAGIQFVELKQYQSHAVEVLSNPNPDNVFEFASKSSFNEKERSLLNAYLKDPSNPQYQKEMKRTLGDIARKGPRVTLFMGASAAIFGVMMAMFLLFPNMKMQLLFIPVPILAKYLVGFYAAYEVYKLIENAPDDNVSHFAHVAGMLFAYILIKLVWKMKRVY